MADFNSSLPVRTEAAGDVIAKIGDGTTPSQQLAIDATGAAKVTQKAGDVWTVQFGSGTITGEIHDYNTAAAVAAGGTSNHDYTVTAGKTLLLRKILVAASGKFKAEIQNPVGTTKAVQFGTGASGANIELEFNPPIECAATTVVRVIRTNKDNQSQDLYSTIIGQEV